MEGAQTSSDTDIWAGVSDGRVGGREKESVAGMCWLADM